MKVELKACDSDPCTGKVDGVQCARRLPVDDVQQALVTALSELKIPLFSLEHPLNGVPEHMGGYLTKVRVHMVHMRVTCSMVRWLSAEAGGCVCRSLWWDSSRA